MHAVLPSCSFPSSALSSTQRSSPLDSLKQQYAAEVVKGDADDKLLKCLEHGIRVPKGVAEPKAWRQVAFLAPKAPRMSSHAESSKVSATQRGAFILFEGGDRCGKTTQSQGLVDHLQASGVKAELWKFPDRQTGTGRMIDSYLTSKTELDDAAVHLLFSANRWEKREAMLSTLESGTTLVVDRYSYSGVVFTAAKQLPGLDLNWCKGPETGLLAPDLVLYLRLPQLEIAAQRRGYGGERYEKTTFQKEVQQGFDAMQDSSWTVLDASKSIGDLQVEVQAAAATAISRCKTGMPLRKLWTVASPPLNSIGNTYT